MDHIVTFKVKKLLNLALILVTFRVVITFRVHFVTFKVVVTFSDVVTFSGDTQLSDSSLEQEIPSLSRYD